MDLAQYLALFCFYGPTPIAAALAGLQATQCKSPLHAFLVALVGTIALAVVFGVAVDYMPLWEQSGGRIWQLHLMFSPLTAVPLAIVSAAWADRRSAPRIG